MSLQYMSLVSDFAGDAYYEAPAGIMGGGPNFTASTLFLVTNVADGVDQYIFANRDAPNFRGWAIGMRGVGAGVPTPRLFVQVGNGLVFFEQTYDIPAALGKIVLVHLSVGAPAGTLGVAINGSPVATGVVIPVGAVASGLAATVGAREGGADPASFCPVVGAGYFFTGIVDIIAEFHLASCRRIYGFADLSAGITGTSWTHYYSSRDAVVPGRGATFVGPLLSALPQAAASWAPGANSGFIADTETRVPLTRTGGSTVNPVVAPVGNPMWSPPL